MAIALHGGAGIIERKTADPKWRLLSSRLERRVTAAADFSIRRLRARRRRACDVMMEDDPLQRRPRRSSPRKGKTSSIRIMDGATLKRAPSPV